jgi:multiple sugar transport system permease protein
MRPIWGAPWVHRAAWYAALLALGLPFLFPFLWMVSAAFKGPSEIFAFPPSVIPDQWRWQNFVEIFRYQPFARQYVNSLYVAVLVTLGTLGVATSAGYAFARLRFPGSTGIFLVLLSALMMPTEVTIIPNFLFMKSLGLVNTHVPLVILPIMGANGVVATFLLRQFFLALPRELEDAAMIDGLGRFGVFWHVAVPLVKPAMGAVSILTFLYSWNLFLEPLVFINDLGLFTLPLALNNFTDTYGLPVWHLQLAATTLSVLPVLAVYVLEQQRIVDSFVLSGVKG